MYVLHTVVGWQFYTGKVHSHRKPTDLQGEMAALENEEWKAAPRFAIWGMSEYTCFVPSHITKSPLCTGFLLAKLLANEQLQ